MATSAMPLEDSVEATLRELRAPAPQWAAQPFTIFRVPSYVRESNRSAYEPCVVSVGPYYHGAAALRAMEDHKWRYLHGLLSRNAALSSRALVEEVRSVAGWARACYSERPGLDSFDDLVRMLLLDGCFILEFFFKWHYGEPDLLCDVGWGIPLVTADLLLLENQIPFFVLERLYGLVLGAQLGTRENLVTLLLECISDEPAVEVPSDTCGINHLLHLYYESFVPKRSPKTGRRRRRAAAAQPTRVIPRAAEMSAAGVSFVQRSPALDKCDVVFDTRRGVMEIPPMVVDDMRRPILVNLIAFEQTLGAEEARLLTNYVSLMGMLVRTAQDVELLRRCGVLDNLLADDEEAADFFRHLGDGGAMNYDRQFFAELHSEVLRYYFGRPWITWWHRNVAQLRRDYFSSPWSVIALVAGTLGLLLTATQTYFTAFPKK